MNLRAFLFENQSVRQTVLRNTFWLTLGQILTRLFKAALIIYVARILGAEGYGVFSYAFSIVMIFYVASDVGVNSVVLREAAKGGEDSQKLVSGAFWLKIILVVSTALVILVLAPFLVRNHTAIGVLRLMILYLVFDTFKDFFISFARAKEKMHIDAFVNALETLTMLVVGIPLLMRTPTPMTLAAAYGIGSGIALLAGIGSVATAIRPFSFRLNTAEMKRVLAYSLPLALGTAIFSILNYTDTIMLGWLKNNVTVGWYTAAFKIPQVILGFGGIVSVAVFPLLARSAESDPQKFRAVTRQAMHGLYLMGFPLVIGGWVVANKFIPAVYGSDYTGAIQPFRILITSLLIIFPLAIINMAAFAKNLQRFTVLYFAFATFINIPLNYIFIRLAGANGAAIATLIAYFLGTLLMLRLLQRSTGSSLLDGATLAKLALAASVMGIVVWYVQQFVSVWVAIPLGALVYLPLLWVLRPSIVRELIKL